MQRNSFARARASGSFAMTMKRGYRRTGDRKAINLPNVHLTDWHPLHPRFARKRGTGEWQRCHLASKHRQDALETSYRVFRCCAIMSLISKARYLPDAIVRLKKLVFFAAPRWLFLSSKRLGPGFSGCRLFQLIFSFPPPFQSTDYLRNKRTRETDRFLLNLFLRESTRTERNAPNVRFGENSGHRVTSSQSRYGESDIELNDR